MAGLETSPVVRSIHVQDFRFTLPAGAGSDAVHLAGQYGYAVCRLYGDSPVDEGSESVLGTGLGFTLGEGTHLVCGAIETLSTSPLLTGRDIESIMAHFGDTLARLANHPALRWLGPECGVVQIALAAISNACWDAWARSRGVPLWKLLLDLSPEELVAALDFSYVEDVMSPQNAVDLLRECSKTRKERESVLDTGYVHSAASRSDSVLCFAHHQYLSPWKHCSVTPGMTQAWDGFSTRMIWSGENVKKPSRLDLKPSS